MANYLLPYVLSSESGRDLARSLNVKRIRNDQQSRYRYRTGDRIVNWGCSSSRLSTFAANHPATVQIATNKIKTFANLNSHGIRTPRWTSDPEIAREWMANGIRIYARKTVSGSRGRGLYGPSSCQSMGWGELALCAFFTQDVSNVREFRVHASKSGLCLVHEKRRRNGYANTASLEIRNYENHWVFCQNNLDPVPPALGSTAVESIRTLGLDFGAVDCCIDNVGKVVVFEVNTAPGLEPRTVEWYTKLINREIFND